MKPGPDVNKKAIAIKEPAPKATMDLMMVKAMLNPNARYMHLIAYGFICRSTMAAQI